MKKIGIKAIIVIMTLLMCLTVVASAEISITHNIPSSWVLSTKQIEITPADTINGIAYLEVNGVSVAGNKGQISQNGTPYYKIKLASETDNELTVDVLLGNISAKTGQFSFRFNENLAYSSVTKSANTELLTKTPSATQKGSFYVDTANRVGYVTWYSADNAVDGTTEEKVLLTLTFEKLTPDYSFNFNTFKGEPQASELYNPALSKGSVIQKVSGTSVTDYCTANQNLDYVIESDGKVFVDNVTALNYVGKASDAVDGKFNVKIINGIGETVKYVRPINIDDTEPQVSFNVAGAETSVSATDISVATMPPSGVTYVSEIIKDNEVVSTKNVSGNSVTFESLETGIYTVKITATTGAGKSAFTTKRVAVGDATLFTPGDVLEDGEVDVRDAVKLLKYIANIETLSESELLAADTLYDGVIDVRDAVKLLKFIANIESSLGAQPAEKDAAAVFAAASTVKNEEGITVTQYYYYQYGELKTMNLDAHQSTLPDGLKIGVPFRYNVTVKGETASSSITPLTSSDFSSYVKPTLVPGTSAYYAYGQVIDINRTTLKLGGFIQQTDGDFLCESHNIPETANVYVVDFSGRTPTINAGAITDIVKNTYFTTDYVDISTGLTAKAVRLADTIVADNFTVLLRFNKDMDITDVIAFKNLCVDGTETLADGTVIEKATLTNNYFGPVSF